MIVTLLTDYGHEDEFVGVCHGVIKRICPNCDLIDVAHEIPRHDVRRGALVLRSALPYMPAGVHVAVVDPEVGSERRAIVVRCDDRRLLVGPDNGLLSLAWERFGGAAEAVDISRSPHRLEPVAATFHGRDLFAPVAAHLAAGAELAAAGERVATEELVSLELPRAEISPGAVTAHALVIDGFGNVGLNVDHEQLAGSGLVLGGAVSVAAQGARLEGKFVRSFAEVPPGEALLYEDAHRALAVAINRGSAAEVLGVRTDDEVRLSPA
jgi:S-adenosylmethionine hydrolase